MAEMRNQKDEVCNTKSNVFAANKSRQERTCYSCGEAGHFQRDCKYGGQISSSTGTCSSSRGRRGAGRGNYVRGRGNYFGCQRGGSVNRTSQQKNEKNIAWVATVDHHAANNTEISKIGCNEIPWVLDSGCTDHIINDDSYFENCEILKGPVDVHMGDDRPVKATKIGNVLSYFDVFGKKNLINMENVFYVKDMKANLISYSKITDNNKIISEGKISKVINDKGNVSAVAVKRNGLYYMKSKLELNISRVNIANKDIKNMTVKEKWHRLLGHVNFKYFV